MSTTKPTIDARNLTLATTGGTSSTLWLQFMEELSSTIQLGGAPQAIHPFQVWDWGGENTLPTMPYAQYQVLDVVPAAPVANTDTAQAAQGFGETYQQWLTMLNATPGQQDKQYEVLQQNITVAEGTLASAQNTALNAYQNFASSTKSSETYTQWLQNEGAADGAQVQQQQQALAEALTALTNYVAAMSTPVAQAVAQYTQNLVSVTNPAGQTVKVPGWTTTESPYSYVLNITGQNFGGNATNGSASTVSVNQSSATYDYSSEYGSSVSVGDLFFFATFSENTWSSVDISQYSSQYTVNFEFQDLSTVDVAPSSWYNSGIVAVRGKNGPYYSNYSGFQNGSDTYFFGPGGSLARQTTAMVVGYRPTLTINAGSSFAQFIQQQQSSAEGFMFGPIYVSMEQGGSFGQSGTVSVENDTIKVTGNGDWPYIVAFVSEWTVAPE